MLAAPIKTPLYQRIFAPGFPQIYDSAWPVLPTGTKNELLQLLADNRTDVVIIATPATTQAQLDAVLREAAGGVPISATKGPQLANGTTSTVTPTAYHKSILPDLLTAHSGNALGFSNVQGGGVVVATAGATTTAVQWTLDNGKRVVTLLGYWRPGERVGCVMSA